MKKDSTLRFLLALGGQKIVVLQDQENLQVFGSPLSRQHNVSVCRLADAVNSK